MFNIFDINFFECYLSYMSNMSEIGNAIKEKRLSQNLRMEDVAGKAGITRATLWAIEKGTANCSVKTLLQTMDVLGLELSVANSVQPLNSRLRASKMNTVISFKRNRFIIMCIVQYASNIGSSFEDVYRQMKDVGLLDEMEEDYEDLHGMSTVYLNEYIKARLGSDK